MTHSREIVHILAVPPSFGNDQLSNQSSINYKLKKQNTENTELTDSQQLTDNVQNVQSGLDIAGVLSKTHTHNKLVKQHADICRIVNSRNVCNCLFFLSKRRTLLCLTFSVLNLYFNLKSNSQFETCCRRSHNSCVHSYTLHC